jgi:hypothetical protein
MTTMPKETSVLSYQDNQLDLINARRAREIRNAADSRRFARPTAPLRLRIRRALVEVMSRTPEPIRVEPRFAPGRLQAK